MEYVTHGGRKWMVDYDTASEAFCRHFFKCFFCRIGDRYTEDHFCETGRELIVAMLDEMDGRS